MTDLYPNPETLAYLHSEAADEKARQRAIVQAREYYAGRHPVYLTDRMREFIGLTGDHDHPFKMNLYKTVVKAVVERLKVTGFDSDEQEQTTLDGAVVKPFAAWAWKRWQQERMDARATKVHKAAVREGRTYVLVMPDEDDQRACFYPHPEFTDPTVGGDGFGMKVFYRDDDQENGELAYATKHWVQKVQVQQGTRLTYRNEKRMTMYWPDRIERYIWSKGEWTLYTEPGIPAVQPWIGADGQPLGVPVIPFCNQDERGRADDAIGLQDALNKALVDIVASADLSAFPILAIFGFYPTKDMKAPEEDGSNLLYTGPGAIVGTTKAPSDADMKMIEGSDLSNLGGHVDRLVQWMAMVSDTPLTRFLATRQIASDETQKAGEGPLVSEAEYLQTIFGDAWEDCLVMAAKIENAFFAAGLPLENVTLATQWAAAATRDQVAEMAAAESRQRLGVPQRTLWAELGYSQTAINAMQQMKDEEAKVEMEQQQALIAARPAPVPFGGK